MRITDVRTTLLRYPCERPIASAAGVIQARPALLVEVITDAGLSGIGESAVGSRALIDSELKAFLVGRDPQNIEWLWQAIYRYFGRAGRRGVVLNALSGIDIALWDLLGKVAGCRFTACLERTRSASRRTLAPASIRKERVWTRCNPKPRPPSAKAFERSR